MSDIERETLVDWGLDLSPGGRRQLFDEQFLTYIALTRASKGLYVSYSLADEEGRGLTPSLLVARLKELFPGLKEIQVLPEPISESMEEQSSTAVIPGSCENEGRNESLQIFPYIAHPRKTLSQLLVQLGRFKKGEKLHPLWWDIYNWYAKSTGWQELGKHLVRVFYQILLTGLRTSLKLYQKRMQVSAPA